MWNRDCECSDEEAKVSNRFFHLQKTWLTHVEERDVENHKVQGHAEGNRGDQVWVGPKRENEEGLVLRERVARVEHFDDCNSNLFQRRFSTRRLITTLSGLTDQDGERHGGRGLGIIVREHLTTDLGEFSRALVEVCELPERDLRPSLVVHEPPSIAKDRGDTDVDADDHVTEEQPGRYEGLPARSRRRSHDHVVGRVKAKGCSRETTVRKNCFQ